MTREKMIKNIEEKLEKINLYANAVAHASAPQEWNVYRGIVRKLLEELVAIKEEEFNENSRHYQSKN